MRMLRVWSNGEEGVEEQGTSVQAQEGNKGKTRGVGGSNGI